MTSHHETNDQQFSAATAMVLAASDLLRVASSNASQLSSALDNTTLQNLAEAIYREVQIAELLYIQLSEITAQSRCEHVFLYPTYPQISVPLMKLNLPQLEQLRNAGEIKLETYESNPSESSEGSHQSTISHLRQTIEDIRNEISNRK